MPRSISMSKVPNLSISPEKVFFIVSKTRQSEMEASEPELIADLEDDDAGEEGEPRAEGAAKE